MIATVTQAANLNHVNNIFSTFYFAVISENSIDDSWVMESNLHTVYVFLHIIIFAKLHPRVINMMIVLCFFYQPMMEKNFTINFCV
jgi:hypothetical protein